MKTISPRLVFAILLMFFSFSSSAATFKCEQDGVTTYSDTPCKTNAQDITDSHVKSLPKKATAATKSRVLQTQKIVKEMEVSRIKRRINRDIDSLEKEIEEKTVTRDAELLALKNSEQQIGYGNDYDDELLAIDLKKVIAAKKVKVEKKYTLEINELNEKLESLQKQLMDTR